MLPPIKKVLYATDLGEHTRPVFRRAVSLARRYDALLLMVHVVEPLGDTVSAIVESYLAADVAAKLLKEEGMNEIVEKMKKRVQRFADEELADEEEHRIPDTEVHVCSGRPSRELLRIAEENNVDVIVMGKSAHSFLGNTMMGTCARRVTRYSNIPVYLVPNND